MRCLEAVVGAGQPGGLRAVPGGAVGPGQHVQPGQQRAGVADVPADRGVRPLALAVAVEPQVQLDQPGRRRRTTSFGKRSAVSLRRAIFAPTTSWWWNATRPSGSRDRVLGLPMSCSSAASRSTRSPSSPYRGSSSMACRSTVSECW